ncbi:radixin-like isoform X1 [Ananas comosus]|uniref:Radixin-like isoform X1 n=1 Tax=Ananas comosus TaxID=4615 RepID=A0A6P5GRY8_ANACO|nr:radixin-like isoform X1 [Ananas comosus]
MANLGKRVDIQSLLALGDDLIGVLKSQKDGDALMQSCEGAKMLRSFSRSDAREIHVSSQEYQEKISACKEKIYKGESETIADAELDRVQKDLEEELQNECLLRQELRKISDELDDLDRQRASIEERREIIKKKKKDMLRAQDLLSMCASVTNIIPSLDDQDKISGYIVDKNKKKVEKFEFEQTLSPYEVCNKLWKME